MINVLSEVKCYEINDKEVKGLDYPTIIVKNHWNDNSSVVLEIEGKKYTVSAEDLKSAIDNAQNVARF